MLSIARNLTGTLIGGIVFGTVWFGHAEAADKKLPQCGDPAVVMAQIRLTAALIGGDVRFYPPDHLPAFQKFMRILGMDPTGEFGIVIFAPENKIAAFVKKGKQLCAVLPPKSDKAPADPQPTPQTADKPKVEGAEWL